MKRYLTFSNGHVGNLETHSNKIYSTISIVKFYHQTLIRRLYVNHIQYHNHFMSFMRFTLTR